MTDKVTTVIPQEDDCYTRTTRATSITTGFGIKPCPYWSARKDKPVQENGYCSFLERGDWEGLGTGLLWDQVKECGVNMDWPESN